MTTQPTTRALGDAAEARALAYLVEHGLVLVARNYRVARGPRARGGEVDLIVRDADGTLVFVEVRARQDARHGGAAASIGPPSGSAWSLRPATTCAALPHRRLVASMSSASKPAASSGCAPPSTLLEPSPR